MVKEYFLTFIPLFVAIDILAVVPIFLSWTEELPESEKSKLITQATATAILLSLVFLFSGKLLFAFLGIAQGDFQIGGGLLLLVLSILDLISAHQEKRRKTDGQLGVVPLGVPLIMGPAALTTILIQVEEHGYGFTLASLFSNLVIVWIVLRFSPVILKCMGKAGIQAFARVMSLFLAAIAVMMIRSGIIQLLKSGSLF